MERGRQLLIVGFLVGTGYFLGSLQVLKVPTLWAQQEEGGPSEEAGKKVQVAYEALRSAMEILKTEGLYKPVTKGVNSYAILAGGLNAEEDLEAGKGVDPETFAALYAGDAIESIAGDLSHDEDGRLTYKNKVVRIYPVSKLKRIYAYRQELTGEVMPTNKKKK